MRLFPASQYMTMIVTKFWKFRYNRLPIEMCDFVYIFQAKVDKLLDGIDDFKMYINDILVLSKNWFMNHIEQLRIIFDILLVAGLKNNSRKCNFWLKEISYLGYVITKGGGIQPNPKKLKWVMDLGQPTTTVEAWLLMSMVPYNMYMWPILSHIMSPLIEAASGPKGRNFFWYDALENYFIELKRLVRDHTL